MSHAFHSNPGSFPYLCWIGLDVCHWKNYIKVNLFHVLFVSTYSETLLVNVMSFIVRPDTYNNYKHTGFTVYA